MANPQTTMIKRILVGAKEKYEPRARQYHEVPGKPK